MADGPQIQGPDVQKRQQLGLGAVEPRFLPDESHATSLCEGETNLETNEASRASRTVITLG